VRAGFEASLSAAIAQTKVPLRVLSVEFKLGRMMELTFGGISSDQLLNPKLFQFMFNQAIDRCTEIE
jgi:hypothetical protein